MRGAFGALHWTPDVFWKSTLTEYTLAIDGFNEAQGGETDAGSGPTDAELNELVAKYG